MKEENLVEENKQVEQMETEEKTEKKTTKKSTKK